MMSGKQKSEFQAVSRWFSVARCHPWSCEWGELFVVVVVFLADVSMMRVMWEERTEIEKSHASISCIGIKGVEFHIFFIFLLWWLSDESTILIQAICPFRMSYWIKSNNEQINQYLISKYTKSATSICFRINFAQIHSTHSRCLLSFLLLSKFVCLAFLFNVTRCETNIVGKTKYEKKNYHKKKVHTAPKHMLCKQENTTSAWFNEDGWSV